MRDRCQTRARQFTVALTIAVALSAALPGAGHAEGCTDIPTAPMAIDRDVFNGRMKGLIGANELIVSTRLMNAAWTGFFFGPSGATVTAYVNNPAAIPTLSCGDSITLASGNAGAAYGALEAKWAPGSVLVLPVATFKGKPGIIAGFVVVEVIEIAGSGNPKFLHGTILGLELDPSLP